MSIKVTGGPIPGFGSANPLASNVPETVKYQRVDGTSAHDDDDEFVGDSSGTPSGWTAIQDSTPRWSFRKLSHRLTAYTDGAVTSTQDMEALVKAMPGTPTAPITIETAIAVQFMPRNYIMAGLCFLNGTSWSTADGLIVGSYVNGATTTLTRRVVTNMGVTSPESNESSGRIADRLYIRFVWESTNTWTVLHSPDGVGWVQWSNTHNYSHTLAPTHMGLIMTPWFSAAGDPGMVSFEYFRVYEEARTEGLD